MNRLLHRLRWYKNRLAAMSGAEMTYRLQEALRRRYDRAYAQDLVAPLRDYGALPEIPGLGAGIDQWHIPDSLMAQWRDDAERAQRGTYIFFGREWPTCAPEHIWHIDPLSEILWPQQAFCFAIDYRHAPGTSDIKYVWELNRLQYLQPIAALARKTKDEVLAKFCLAQIESWIDHNPPFLGVNWNSGIELSLRAISILTVTSLVGGHLSRAARGKIWSCLHTHARWIARYPSRYSSANNHRTAEGLGLFTLGALCPHFPESESWKKNGWSILCDAARQQILPDGGGAEQAVAYAASVLETLLTGLKIAQARAVPVPDFYVRKLTLGGEYLRWLCDSGAGYPHIGDDDDAGVFGTHHKGDLYVSNIVSSIAAVTGRSDLSPPLTQPHVRQALFGFAPAPDFAPYGARCFPYAGMSIGRHTSAQGDIMLAFDHGYLGYLSIAAHGHADALALWLHIGDQPVFVDAGTYLYHAQPEERCFFRGTCAHNTMGIEHADSSTMSGPFNWSHKATTTLRSFASHGDGWQVEAEHDGYDGTFQSLHRRSLHVSAASGAVIEDTLLGPAARYVDIAFLLHPALTARREGHDILVLKGEQLLLRLRHESHLNMDIGMPNTPQGGWYAPSFRVKQATTRLSFNGNLAPNHKAVTHLFWAA
jgi:hypothetical protein